LDLKIEFAKAHQEYRKPINAANSAIWIMR